MHHNCLSLSYLEAIMFPLIWAHFGLFLEYHAQFGVFHLQILDRTSLQCL
jgi:hypothetical protein